MLVTQHAKWIASRLRRALFGQSTSSAVASQQSAQLTKPAWKATSAISTAQRTQNNCGHMKRLKAAFSNFPCSVEATKVGTNVGRWGFSSLTAVDGCFQFSKFPSFSRFPTSLNHRREKHEDFSSYCVSAFLQSRPYWSAHRGAPTPGSSHLAGRASFQKKKKREEHLREKKRERTAFISE